MSWLIIIFGVVQGTVEFLPVSSTAHLLFLAEIFNTKDSFETYVLLNIGTLGALCYFSRQVIWQAVKDLKRFKFDLIVKLIASSLPAAGLGFFLLPFFADLGTNLILISSMLISVGILMILKTPPTKPEVSLETISWPQVWSIGGLQSLALIPGTSRLAITTLGGLWQGFSRQLALKWSFLLAIPIVLGAIMRVLINYDSFIFIQDNFIYLIVANIVTFIIGLGVIHLAFKLMVKYSLKPFGWYRIGLGLIILSFLAFNVL